MSKAILRELEVHRAELRAVKDAGFNSPVELLAAYRHLAVQDNETRRKVDELIVKLNERDACIKAFITAGVGNSTDLTAQHRAFALAAGLENVPS